jgi:hypothetical protein
LKRFETFSRIVEGEEGKANPLKSGGMLFMFVEIISNLLRSGKKGGFRRNLLAIYLRKIHPVTLYHGTSDVYVPSIRSGIKTMTGVNFRGRSQFGEGFYLTRLKIAAQYFADIAAQNTGGKPEILRFKIPRNAFKKLKGYETIGAEYREFSWRMPSRFIENFDYLSGQISGLEPWKQVKFNPRAYHILNRFLG